MKLSVLLRSLRPTQWTKNVFVAAPLVFSFKLTDLSASTATAFATVIFCLLASALYIINDILDVEADRAHPKKKFRPIAAGQVTVGQAMALVATLIAAAALLLFYADFNRAFWIFLVLYLALSIFYSLHFKQVPLLELFIVSSGYILRLLAGCAAINEAPSPWILTATGALALLIVAGKRRAEIAENHDPEKRRRSLREYNLAFLDSMITMLSAVTVVTYLLFTTSEYAIGRYGTPYLVGTSIFVLYGVLRYMQIIKVMKEADDPTALVLTDPGVRYAVMGWILSCIAIIYFR